MTTNDEWLAGEAAVGYKIRSRILPTLSGESPLRFFDGATMTSYMYPPKASEVVFCRSFQDWSNNCFERNGLDPEQGILSASMLEEAHQGPDPESSMSGVPRASVIGLDEAIHAVNLSPRSCDLIIKRMKSAMRATVDVTRSVSVWNKEHDMSWHDICGMYDHMVSERREIVEN